MRIRNKATAFVAALAMLAGTFAVFTSPSGAAVSGQCYEWYDNGSYESDHRPYMYEYGSTWYVIADTFAHPVSGNRCSSQANGYAVKSRAQLQAYINGTWYTVKDSGWLSSNSGYRRASVSASTFLFWHLDGLLIRSVTSSAFAVAGNWYYSYPYVIQTIG